MEPTPGQHDDHDAHAAARDTAHITVRDDTALDATVAWNLASGLAICSQHNARRRFHSHGEQYEESPGEWSLVVRDRIY